MIDMADVPEFSLTTVTTGMPRHPEIEDRSVLWLTAGDEWWWRRCTNVLVPKSMENLAPKDAKVRYVMAAVKHDDSKGGGFDWTMWTEHEIMNDDEKTANVGMIVCIPPSFAESEDLLNKSFVVAALALEQVYKEVVWKSQYDHSAAESGEKFIVSKISRKKKWIVDSKSLSGETADVKP